MIWVYLLLGCLTIIVLDFAGERDLIHAGFPERSVSELAGEIRMTALGVLGIAEGFLPISETDRMTAERTTRIEAAGLLCALVGTGAKYRRENGVSRFRASSIARGALKDVCMGDPVEYRHMRKAAAGYSAMIRTGAGEGVVLHTAAENCLRDLPALPSGTKEEIRAFGLIIGVLQEKYLLYAG